MTEEKNWATEGQYQEAVGETNDLTVPEGQQDFRVQTMSPIRYATLIEEYNITEIGEKIDENAELGGEETEEVLQFVKFYEEIIIPNIQEPKYAHWNDTPGILDIAEIEMEENKLMINTQEKGDVGFMETPHLDGVDKIMGPPEIETFNKLKLVQGVPDLLKIDGIRDILGVFDVSNMHEDDLIALVGGIVDEDPEEMKQAAEEKLEGSYDGKFQ